MTLCRVRTAIGAIAMLAAGAIAAAGASLQGCFILAPEEPSDNMEAGPDVLSPPVCEGTFANCDEVSINGCEVDLDSDPSHCGACETQCEGGGCNAGQCGVKPEVLVSGLINPMRLRIAFDSLYFATAGEVDTVAQVQFGSIVRVGIDGSELTVLAGEQLGPDDIAVDDTHVYWTNAGGGTLLRMDKLGGDPITVVSGQRAPRALAIDADYLYWTTSLDQAVMRSTHDGAGVTALWQGQQAVLSIALSGSSVVFGTSDGVRQVPTSGGESTLIATGQRNAVGVFASTDAIFWITQGRTGVGQDGAVWWSAPASPQASELANHQGGPLSVVADDQSVYWTNYATATVMKAPRSGGKAVMLASHQAKPWGLAQTTDALYWTSMEGGEIRKMAK